MRMIPEDLTKRQAEALRAYKAMTDANDGITPTVRALGEKLGIGHTATHILLTKLREKGYLTMPPITQTRMRFTAKGKRAGDG